MRAQSGQSFWLRDMKRRVLACCHASVQENERNTYRRSSFRVLIALLVLLGGFVFSDRAGRANASPRNAGGATNNSKVNGASASPSNMPMPQAVPPTITSPPVTIDLSVGQAATFSVTATGTAPLSYQWQKGGTAISGATAASYTTPPTTAADDRTFFAVVVSNSAGSVTSSNSMLLVHVAPYIPASQPANVTVNAGQTATFTVAAAMGQAPLSYQWKKGTTTISGAASSSYTTPATTSTDNGAQFTAVVSNSAGSATSNAAALTVNSTSVAPSITTQPASSTVNLGQTATFTVAATGTAPLTYQWKKGTTTISGATSSSYTTPATTSSDNGAQFTAVVSNSAGSATSNVATLTVNANPDPSITTQPASITVNAGLTATFTVVAGGTSPFSYQWKKAGTAISGATSSSYTTPATTISDSGSQFTVVVSNSVGNVTSNVATLTVTTGGTTTAYGLTFPNTHPRLFWTPSRITTANNWVASTNYGGLTVNYRPLDGYDVAFSCYIMNISAACTQAITDATTFVPASPNGTGNGDDNMRALGEQRMLVRDWMAPGCGKASCLSAGQVTTFDSSWSTWQANQDIPTQTWGNIGMPASNYFCGQFRNDFDFGIASYIENTTNADANLKYGANPQTSAVSRWNDLLNFVSPTGTGKNGTFGYELYNQEGGGEYGRYCLNYYAFSLASSALLNRDMWTETSAFKSGVVQTIYNTMLTQTTGRSVWDGFTWGDDENWVNGANCGYVSHNGPDGHGGCGMSSQLYGDFMQAAATEYSSTNIGEYARQWIATVNPAIGPVFKSVDSGGSTLAYTNLPLDYYSSGAQYMYAHDSWNTTGTTMLWQLGLSHGGNTDPNSGLLTGHSHFDAGTFQVARKGVNIIRETMGYSDSVAGYNGGPAVASLTGYAHNIPFIGGRASMNAFDCADGPGVVQRLETQPAYAFAEVDLSLTYHNLCDSNHQDNNNTYAVSVVRELYYFRSINVLVVADRLQTDNSTRSTTFVSHCETNPTVVSATVKCIDGAQEAFYTALVPASPTIAIVAENNANGVILTPPTLDPNWQYRIEANNSNPGNVVSYNIYTIQLGDATGFSALTPSVVDSVPGNPLSGTFTITLGPSDSLVINKGIASSGGTIKAAGSTKALATTVQGMTITDNGPLWQ
jgi:hypothetical protein